MLSACKLRNCIRLHICHKHCLCRRLLQTSQQSFRKLPFSRCKWNKHRSNTPLFQIRLYEQNSVIHFAVNDAFAVFCSCFSPKASPQFTTLWQIHVELARKRRRDSTRHGGSSNEFFVNNTLSFPTTKTIALHIPLTIPKDLSPPLPLLRVNPILILRKCLLKAERISWVNEPCRIDIVDKFCT
jgi:hypothetical protein